MDIDGVHVCQRQVIAGRIDGGTVNRNGSVCEGDISVHIHGDTVCGGIILTDHLRTTTHLEQAGAGAQEGNVVAGVGLTVNVQVRVQGLGTASHVGQGHLNVLHIVLGHGEGIAAHAHQSGTAALLRQLEQLMDGGAGFRSDCAVADDEAVGIECTAGLHRDSGFLLHHDLCAPAAGCAGLPGAAVAGVHQAGNIQLAFDCDVGASLQGQLAVGIGGGGVGSGADGVCIVGCVGIMGQQHLYVGGDSVVALCQDTALCQHDGRTACCVSKGIRKGILACITLAADPPGCVLRGIIDLFGCPDGVKGHLGVAEILGDINGCLVFDQRSFSREGVHLTGGVGGPALEVVAVTGKGVLAQRQRFAGHHGLLGHGALATVGIVDNGYLAHGAFADGAVDCAGSGNVIANTGGGVQLAVDIQGAVIQNAGILCGGDDRGSGSGGAGQCPGLVIFAHTVEVKLITLFDVHRAASVNGEHRAGEHLHVFLDSEVCTLMYSHGKGTRQGADGACRADAVASHTQVEAADLHIAVDVKGRGIGSRIVAQDQIAFFVAHFEESTVRVADQAI